MTVATVASVDASRRSSSAARVAACRRRQRRGIKVLPLHLSQSMLEAVSERGYREAMNPSSVRQAAQAVEAFLSDTLFGGLE